MAPVLARGSGPRLVEGRPFLCLGLAVPATLRVAGLRALSVPTAGSPWEAKVGSAVVH